MKVSSETGWISPTESATHSHNTLRESAAPSTARDSFTSPPLQPAPGVTAILAAYERALPAMQTGAMPTIPQDVLQNAGDHYEAALAQVAAQLEPREKTVFASLVGHLSQDAGQRRFIINRLASANLGGAFSLATGYLALNLDKPAGLVAILGLVEQGTPTTFHRALVALLFTPTSAA